MRLAVNVLELFFDEVRIDLRGRNIGVTQHFLNRMEIRAVLEQMRCERMAERVRRDGLFNPLFRRVEGLYRREKSKGTAGKCGLAGHPAARGRAYGPPGL